MPLEIERKFLIKPNLLDLPKEGQKLIQGYIWSDPDKSLRIRIAGDQSFLTIKTGNNPLNRSEFEYQIPMKDAQDLLVLCDSKIEKTRFVIPQNNLFWEIDVFEGDNKGLIVAEIELSSENENFELPQWIDREVTNESKFLNVELIKHPFSKW
ncbi:CYTH domain-containing protein [Labilibaculum euxinus]|uniref:CYTH domain-containing protein n=1 Tax=Labilibaculum euxinus TaxID=2686357 RepID=A0A7M4DBL8_9BACT|nr:CYTH domain-containing protein [Labilibaculum euxinus]MUP40047.1 CYTH domain-containing protein [Labilibaculum euxinus]MVB09252.1 CYTH domain-containing protein [Labilibaculum euxinus]